jgi:hypothetical protein
MPYGGTEYLSTSTFDNCTVEEMCDFFNCDETRASWDRLLFRYRVGLGRKTARNVLYLTIAS